MPDELRNWRCLQARTRPLAKFKKRGRYKYSGFTNQQKYNRKGESLKFANILLENLKLNGIAETAGLITLP